MGLVKFDSIIRDPIKRRTLYVENKISFYSMLLSFNFKVCIKSNYIAIQKIFEQIVLILVKINKSIVFYVFMSNWIACSANVAVVVLLLLLL